MLLIIFHHIFVEGCYIQIRYFLILLVISHFLLLLRLIFIVIFYFNIHIIVMIFIGNLFYLMISHENLKNFFFII
jgi:hypothetical protein